MTYQKSTTERPFGFKAYGTALERDKEARRLSARSSELAEAGASTADDKIPIAILPNSDACSLIDVVGILVRAQNPALSGEPEANRTAEWERQARSIRNDVMSAAESGTLRVCLRDKCLAKGFDKNAVQNYVVKLDDLQHWLESRSVKWQQASPPAQIAVSAESSPTSTLKSGEGNPVDAAPATLDIQDLPDEKPEPIRQDALALQLDEMLRTMRASDQRITANAVFAKLREGIGPKSCVVDASRDGALIWERTTGRKEKIGVDGIQKRIARWKEKNPAKPR